MTMHFVLIHAPVLGPASWHPVRDELVQAGYRATVPSLADFAVDGPPYAPRLLAQFADQQQARQGPADLVVLVPHSGAGIFADQFAAASASTGSAMAVIFADAGLPSRSGVTPVADRKFLPYLRELAVNGMVPAWPDWWPDADPAEVFPTEVARSAVLADARPLPLAFFEETLPASDRPSPPAGYLLLSEGYQEAAAQARSRGWPVAELSGSHLHPLVQPAQVAAALIELAGRLQLP